MPGATDQDRVGHEPAASPSPIGELAHHIASGEQQQDADHHQPAVESPRQRGITEIQPDGQHPKAGEARHQYPVVLGHARALPFIAVTLEQVKAGPPAQRNGDRIGQDEHRPARRPGQWHRLPQGNRDEHCEQQRAQIGQRQQCSQPEPALQTAAGQRAKRNTPPPHIQRDGHSVFSPRPPRSTASPSPSRLRRVYPRAGSTPHHLAIW